MKKGFYQLLVMIALVLSANMLMAQTYTYPAKGPKGFSLTSKSADKVEVNYSVQHLSFETIAYRGEEMKEIVLDNGIVLPNDAGLPNLPAEGRMIAIPQGAKPVLKVLDCQKEIIKNVNVAPALRLQNENEEPEMDYKKDMKVYGKNAFYPEQPFLLNEAYIRGVDAVNLTIMPFQYNPVTKDLIVYTNVKVAIEFEGGTRHFGDDRLRSPYWDPILAAELMNYDQLPVIDYEARMQQWLRDEAEGAEYLIITPNNDAWVEYANQLKDFRTRQGIITKVYRLDEMPANTTAQMKSWFHNAYNTWTIAPAAVCLLGDHGTNMGQYIPAEVVSHPYEGSCITDNRYADPSGDNLPDMVFSRLVAETANQLPVLVGKQIEYEFGSPNTDPDFYTRPITALGWQDERWFQICSEVFGGYMRQKGYDPNRINCIYSGSPGSVWSTNQNTSMAVNYFGPNGTGYIPASPSEMGGWTGGTPEQVVQAVNQGTFWVQHRDHGLETGWGEPAVRNSHVNQMNNVGKLPFVMSINCSTGMFNYNSDCFCEAWMRRTYNGQNAGAVGVLCPTQVSYSFVNDTYVWGVYDLFDGDFLPTYGPYASHTGNWMPAFGNVAGKYFLAQSSWPSNPESKDITFTMFTAHCDAFLRIFNQVPQQMDVIHPEVVLANQETVSVSAPEGCMISLVKQGEDGGWEILAVTQATGDIQNIAIEPQFPPTEIHLIATGQNYLRYEAVMSVIPAEGAYVVLDSKTIQDTDGNGQADYAETVNLDVTLRNVGVDAISDFEAVLETNSEYISITNGTAQFNGLAPDATQTLANAFTFVVADNVPDNTPNLFTINVTNGDDTYVSKLTVRAYAPIIELGNMGITELSGNGNGRLDAGETAQLSFSIKNAGHSSAFNAEASLTLLSPYINLERSLVEIDTINASEITTATYTISIDESTPTGYICPMILNVTSGQYGATKDYAAKVGLILEDFETGAFTGGWASTGGNPWRFDTQNPYEGNYCVRSGNIGNNSSTTMTLTHEAGTNDTISFYYAVSSESGWDKLHFSIDDTELSNWSGNISWTQASYPVSAGQHTYTWTYTKDQSVSSGQDCAWIDYVSLPAARVMAGTAGNDITVCQGEQAQIVGYAIYYQSLAWSTSGDGSFLDDDTATPIYIPGPQDNENGSVTLTLTLTAGNETLTDDMTLLINRNVQIENALPEAYYCAVAEPQEVGVTLDGDYSSLEWSTNGDGTFDNPNDLMTTYTPGAQDIANGTLNLTVSVETTSCGTTSLEIPFEMHPLPTITVPDILMGATYCAIPEPQDIGVEVTGAYSVFEWSTNGDGTFGNVNELTTTYTPGSQDIANGTVTLTATAESSNCGTVLMEIPFVMNPQPQFSFPVPNCEVTLCQGQDLSVEYTASGYVNGMMTIDINGETYTLVEGENTLVFPTSSDQAGNYQLEFSNLSNGLCPSDYTTVFNYSIIELPTLSVNQQEVTVCEGETATFELTATGGMVNNPQFTVHGTGIETIEINGYSYTLELTPSESMDIKLTQILALNPNCETYCGNDIDLNMHVEVLPKAEAPEIEGDAEIDAHITPSTTYAVTNDVRVEYEMEPAEAGTLLPANDGLSVVVTWSQTFKGNAVLTAIPTTQCSQGNGRIEIQVKNSNEIGENTHELKVYPNPASEKITIQGLDMTHIALYSTLGQLMYETRVNSQETSVEVSSYPAGTYIVKVTCGDTTYTQLINIVK